MPSRTGCPVAGFAFLHLLGVDLVHLDLIDLFTWEQVGLAEFLDFDLLQHLANDHLDCLSLMATPWSR